MNWALEEFEEISLGDERLNKRAGKILSCLGDKPSLSIPGSCKGWDETMASYRFFQNDKVTVEKLLSPHIESSLKRMKEHKTVLLVQDTTELDYTSKKNKIDGVGVLNHKRRRGLLCHPLVAFSPERVCLGVLDLHTWGRSLEEFGKSDQRYQKAIQDKESYRWIEGYRKASEYALKLPGTETIMVADRESDIYDLFEESAKLGDQGCEWIVRGKFDRALTQKNEDNSFIHLYEQISSQESLGSIEFDLPNKRRRKSTVRQSLKACKVKLRPPHRSHEKLSSQEITVVLARELQPPEGKKPIEWFLLTSKEVNSYEDAVQIIQHYLCRWEIEVFFKVLKSGCKVEELQLEHLSHLVPCLALYSIIAWRVLFLTMISRECPDLPCGEVFEEDEWKAAYVVTTEKKPPEQPPPLSLIMKYIAQFGGHLGRKNDPSPGATAIWIGLQRNKDFTLARIAVLASMNE